MILNNFFFKLIPKKAITFFFSVEQKQDISAYISKEEIFEMYGEKLKQDFIKFALDFKLKSSDVE